MITHSSDLASPFPSGARVLLADDDHDNSLLLAEMLQLAGYRVTTARNAADARRCISNEPPDLILLDVIMPPGITGIELCRQLKSDSATRLIPVVLITGLTESDARLSGIEAGADDYVNKPVDPQQLFARIRSLLKLKQFTDELENAETVLFSLALGVEARDPYTHGHCGRLSQHSAALGWAMGLDEIDVVALRRGGVLHDIGKISVPDEILNKKGPLDPEESRIIRMHPITGEQICSPLNSLRRVLPIIRHHHEHWNGRGYPDGLRGAEIPLLARILQVTDAYDALTTARPYKPAWSRDEAKDAMMAEARDGWWDRDIVDAFFRLIDDWSLPEVSHRAG